MKLKVFVASSPERVKDTCNATCRGLLEEHFEVRWNSGPELSAQHLVESLDDVEILLTSWGSPSLDEAALKALPQLRLIGHAAGTVKSLLPPNVFDYVEAVFSAAPRIAESVGEYCLGATLAMLRRFPGFDAQVRAGNWKDSPLRGQELSGRRVGIVGGSSTARAFLRLLAPFNIDSHLYDPYMSEVDARNLGVTLSSLEDVMRSDVVSIHLPATDETKGMITGKLLSLIPTGALLINSSRGSTLDMRALYAEIASRRIFAALDVFDPEPPTLDQAMRTAENVLLSPHVAGDTVAGHLALMEFVVRDIIRWIDRAEPGRSFVAPAVWRLSA